MGSERPVVEPAARSIQCSPSGSCLCWRGPVDVVLVDEAGAGEHRLAATDRVEVVLVQREEDDRQVPLEVLLLVDGEQHVAVDDRLDHVLAEVERADEHVAGLADLVDRGERGRGTGRAEREHGVDGVVGLQRGADGRLRRRRRR